VHEIAFIEEHSRDDMPDAGLVIDHQDAL
jgi:hypothetical protein